MTMLLTELIAVASLIGKFASGGVSKSSATRYGKDTEIAASYRRVKSWQCWRRHTSIRPQGVRT
jgi:hypothetical protein